MRFGEVHGYRLYCVQNFVSSEKMLYFRYFETAKSTKELLKWHAVYFIKIFYENSFR